MFNRDKTRKSIAIFMMSLRWDPPCIPPVMKIFRQSGSCQKMCNFSLPECLTETIWGSRSPFSWCCCAGNLLAFHLLWKFYVNGEVVRNVKFFFTWVLNWGKARELIAIFMMSLRWDPPRIPPVMKTLRQWRSCQIMCNFSSPECLTEAKQGSWLPFLWCRCVRTLLTFHLLWKFSVNREDVS